MPNKSCLVPIDVGSKTRPRRVMRYYAEVPANTVDDHLRVTCDNRLAVDLRNANLYNALHLQLIQGDRYYPVSSGAAVRNLYVTKPDGRKVRFLGPAYSAWFLKALRGAQSRDGLLPDILRQRKLIAKSLYDELNALLQCSPKSDATPKQILRKWERLTTQKGVMSDKDYKSIIRGSASGGCPKVTAIRKGVAKKPNAATARRDTNVPELKFTEFLQQTSEAAAPRAASGLRIEDLLREDSATKAPSRVSENVEVQATVAPQKSTEFAKTFRVGKSTRHSQSRSQAKPRSALGDKKYSNVVYKTKPPRREASIAASRNSGFRPLQPSRSTQKSQQFQPQKTQTFREVFSGSAVV